MARLRSASFFLNQRGVQPFRSDPSITECGFEAWIGLSVRFDQVHDIGLQLRILVFHAPVAAGTGLILFNDPCFEFPQILLDCRSRQAEFPLR